MFWLKSCPRCQGDLHENSDIYGSYIDCLQCGHYLTVDEDASLRSGNHHGIAYSLVTVEPSNVPAEPLPAELLPAALLPAALLPAALLMEAPTKLLAEVAA
ncbi:MAG: hypothetical protein O2913_06575 [Chloroflexi bacterium]|nr:hypothetical protein [Chloroflexota bacterium]